MVGLHNQSSSETIPYRFHVVESILKEVWEIDSKEDYENYKKTINFFNKNFPSIVSGLQSHNISIKKQCVEFLGYIYDYRSVDPLITSLNIHIANSDQYASKVWLKSENVPWNL